MIDHDVLPVIAIAGGCGALLLLACIALAFRRRRRIHSTPRKTSFHMAVIDPAIADLQRAAWEHAPVLPVRAAVMPITPVAVQIPNIDPPREMPRRFARGSKPALEAPARGASLAARPHGWDVHMPSVTARMRAVRRPT
jgi:hypothetical protein